MNRYTLIFLVFWIMSLQLGFFMFVGLQVVIIVWVCFVKTIAVVEYLGCQRILSNFFVNFGKP